MASALQKLKAKRNRLVGIQKPEFQTSAQVFVSSNGFGPVILNNTPTGKKVSRLSTKYRRRREKYYDEMLRDPTIRLAVDLIVALLMQQDWTIEGDNEQYCQYTWSQLNPFRKMLIRSSIRGQLKDGWRVFECAFGLDVDPILGLRQTATGMKALRSAVTDVLVDTETGEVVGAENRASAPTSAEGVILDREHIIFVNFDDDGYGDYGEELLRSVSGPHEKWQNCDEGAQRYDNKVAGGFLHLKYPEGTTKYAKNNNEETNNAVIANDFLESIRASGYAATPVKVDDNDGGDPVLTDVWKLEHVAAAGSLQPSFITRLKYLDALKLRLFGIPERSTTEGTFGTKAESEAHADIAVLINTQRHERIIDAVNAYWIPAFCLSNFANAGACKLVLGKLKPQDRELFSTIFTALMTDPILGDDVSKKVDVEQLLEKLDIPTIQEGDFSTTPEIS